MESITKEELRHYRALHRALWLWLSRHPMHTKAWWPHWKVNGGKVPCVINFCFACHVGELLAGTNHITQRCLHCPVDWPTGQRGVVQCQSSYYEVWRQSNDAKERTEMALLIARAWPHVRQMDKTKRLYDICNNPGQLFSICEMSTTLLKSCLPTDTFLILPMNSHYLCSPEHERICHVLNLRTNHIYTIRTNYVIRLYHGSLTLMEDQQRWDTSQRVITTA